MINNLEKILNLLEFKNIGDFYVISIIRRKKDQPEKVKDNYKSSQLIKTIIIESKTDLVNNWKDIIVLAESTCSRVYIELRRLNHEDVTKQLLKILATRIISKSWDQAGLFEKAIGSTPTQNRLWIIDIDDLGAREIDKIKSYLFKLGNNIIIDQIETPNGSHLITIPFDLKKFELEFPEIGVHKRAPTLLYFPKSLT